MIRNYKYGYLLIIMMFSMIAFSLAGCDFSSRSDLERAERELKKADKANAEFWAEPEFKKAQKYLNEAMDFTHERKINEARDAALEARYWAREATELSIRRAEEMEREHDKLKIKDF